MHYYYIITNILLLFNSCCCNLFKTGRSGEICTCTTWTKLFSPNAHPHSWFTYLLLIKLKMYITISDWSFIWKYKDMLENLKMKNRENLEKPNLRRRAQWVKVLQINRRVPDSNSTRHSSRFREISLWHPEDSQWPWGQNLN